MKIIVMKPQIIPDQIVGNSKHHKGRHRLNMKEKKKEKTIIIFSNVKTQFLNY